MYDKTIAWTVDVASLLNHRKISLICVTKQISWYRVIFNLQQIFSSLN